MSNIHFRAIPTFRITNYESAKEFYVDFLGFIIDWEHRFHKDEPVYMQLSKNGMIIHLSQSLRFQSGTIVFVETSGIERFRNELKSKQNDFSVPEIAITNWGTKQMEVIDPFGNLLRFNQNI